MPAVTDTNKDFLDAARLARLSASIADSAATAPGGYANVLKAGDDSLKTDLVETLLDITNTQTRQARFLNVVSELNFSLSQIPAEPLRLLCNNFLFFEPNTLKRLAVFIQRRNTPEELQSNESLKRYYTTVTQKIAADTGSTRYLPQNDLQRITAFLNRIANNRTSINSLLKFALEHKISFVEIPGQGWLALAEKLGKQKVLTDDMLTDWKTAYYDKHVAEQKGATQAISAADAAATPGIIDTLRAKTSPTVDDAISEWATDADAKILLRGLITTRQQIKKPGTYILEPSTLSGTAYQKQLEEIAERIRGQWGNPESTINKKIRQTNPQAKLQLEPRISGKVVVYTLLSDGMHWRTAKVTFQNGDLVEASLWDPMRRGMETGTVPDAVKAVAATNSGSKKAIKLTPINGGEQTREGWCCMDFNVRYVMRERGLDNTITQTGTSSDADNLRRVTTNIIADQEGIQLSPASPTARKPAAKAKKKKAVTFAPTHEVIPNTSPRVEELDDDATVVESTAAETADTHKDQDDERHAEVAAADAAATAAAATEVKGKKDEVEDELSELDDDANADKKAADTADTKADVNAEAKSKSEAPAELITPERVPVLQDAGWDIKTPTQRKATTKLPGGGTGRLDADNDSVSYSDIKGEADIDAIYKQLKALFDNPYDVEVSFNLPVSDGDADKDKMAKLEKYFYQKYDEWKAEHNAAQKQTGPAAALPSLGANNGGTMFGSGNATEAGGKSADAEPAPAVHTKPIVGE
jgi:hypothetical protein